MKRVIYWSSGLLLSAGLTYAVYYLHSLIPVVTGYAAKHLCSAVFISNRDPAEVEASDLDFSLVRFVTNSVSYSDRSVVSRFLWVKSRAVFTERFGSTLLHDPVDNAFIQRSFPAVSFAGYDPDTLAWPLGNVVPDSVRVTCSAAMDDITGKLMAGLRYGGKVYAFMVIHKGLPVAERYSRGFTAGTLFPSWSMAKSFTNAFAGAMVMKGLLDITEKAAIPGWSDDGRREITINNLMQMQSGLRWNEDYGNHSDVTKMLYEHGDFAAYAIGMPQDHPAGSHWYYSSGSANILSLILRRHFRDDSSYYLFPYREVFQRIGMQDVIFETDQSGTFTASSYIYATARDYARFGLLYLGDGVFNGERILPGGWVSYSSTPAIHSGGNYGTLFWLNKGRLLPSAPEDMFFCNGYDGQRIFIIPSADLVVVALGHSHRPENDLNFDLLLKDILGSLPGPGQTVHPPG